MIEPTDFQIDLLCALAQEAYKYKQLVSKYDKAHEFEKENEASDLCEDYLGKISLIIRFACDNPYIGVSPGSKLLQEKPTPKRVRDWFMGFPAQNSPR